MFFQADEVDVLAPRGLPLSQSRPARGIVACTIVFITLSTLAVIGRFGARRIQRTQLHVDDWLMILSELMAYGHGAVSMYSVIVGGAGYHIYNLTPYNISQYFKSLSILHFFFGISLGSTRISICLFLMRIFKTERFKLYASMVLAYQVCWTIMMILIGSLLCRPFRFNWDKSIDGTCGNQKAVYIAIAITDLVADTMLVILPLPNIWRLHTSLSKKFGLTFVFALGIIDMAVGILRIIFVFYIDFAKDFTWMSTQGWVWSIIEPNLAIIVACSPVLQPLVRITYHQVELSINTIHKSLLSFKDMGRSQSSSTRTSNGHELGKYSSGSDPSIHHKPGDVSLIYAEINEDGRA